MGLLGLIFPLLSLVAFIANVWLLVIAFRKSALWGVLVLFFSPITAIVFSILNWEESKKPFLIYSGSIAACLGIVFIMMATVGFQLFGMANEMSQDGFDEADAKQFIEANMDRMEDSGMLSEQEQEDLRQMRQVLNEMPMEDEPAEVDGPLTLGPIPGVTPVSPESSGTIPLSPEDAALRARLNKYFAGRPVVIDGEILVPLGYKAVPVSRARSHLGEWTRVVSTSGLEHRGVLSKAGPEHLQLTKYLTAGTFSFELRREEVRALHVRYR